jgi:polyhydroxybutyrate depolymerase
VAVACEDDPQEATAGGTVPQTSTTRAITYSSPPTSPRPPTTTVAPAAETTTTVTAAPPPTAPGPCSHNGYVDIPSGRRALVRANEATEPRPAILVLHGYTGSPEHVERTTGWTPFAREAGALVAYPEGTGTPTEGFGWNTGSARFSTSGTDDVAFLGELVDHLVATACVDPARVMITGESNGGAMTLLAGCSPEISGRFRLVAPVIPAIDDGVLARCGAGAPLSFVALAGLLDRTVPYDGVYRANEIPLLGQEYWFLKLAADRNGCGFGPPTRVPVPGGEAVRPEGCPDAPLLVAIPDAPHTWPGGPLGNGGMDPGTFPATAYLWSIFTGT